MNMISTGAFLPETDASTKQNELVKKLTAAWEKKNSKTARAGGASLMALSLAACGGEDNTPFSAADVSAAEAAATTAALTGADGTVYASVDAAVTSNDTAIADAARAEGVASVDITTDNQAAIDAAVAAVDLTTDNAAAIDAAVAADTAFASLSDLVAAYDALVAPTTSALTTSTDTLVGTNGDDTFSGAAATYADADQVIDASTTDADTYTLTIDAAATPQVTNVETVTVNHNALTAGALNVGSMTGVEVLNVTRGDVVVGGSTLTGNKVVNITEVSASDIGKIVASGSNVTINQEGVGTDGGVAGVVVEATATGDIVVEGAVNLTATGQGSADSVTVNVLNTAATGTTAAAENAKAVSITTDAVGAAGAGNGIVVGALTGDITVTAANVLDVDINNTAGTGAITIDAGASTQTDVVSAAGGATITSGTTSTADSTITVAGIDSSGATITTGTGVSAASGKNITVTLTGGTDSTDVATISGDGYISIGNTNVDTLTLSGASGDVTYNVTSGAATITGSGSHAVSLRGDEARFDGKTITGVKDLTLTGTAGQATDVSKASVEKVIVTYDVGATATVTSGQKVELTADQTGLTFGLAATASTSDLTLVAGDEDTASSAVGTVTTGALATGAGAVTGTLTIEANDSNLTATGVTLGTKQNLVITGDEDVTLGTVSGGTTTSINASDSTGKMNFTVTTAAPTVTTGSGDDTLVINGADVHTVSTNGGADNITITDTDAASTIDGGDGDDIIALNDTNTAYVVIGGAGDDHLDIGTAADMVVVGGAGTADTLDVAGALNTTASTNFAISSVEEFELDDANGTVRMTAAQFGNNNTVKLEGAGGDDIFQVEMATTGGTIDASGVTVESTQAVTINYVGSAKADTITGGAADETIAAGHNAGTITTAGTGGGADAFDGGAGTDTFDASGLDAVTETGTTGASAGAVINLSSAAVTGASVFSQISNYISGGLTEVAAGNVAYTFATNSTATSSTVSTIANIENVNGTAGEDYIVGTSGNNTLDGKAGNDYISGGAGADTLDGDTGADIILGGSGQDDIALGATDGATDLVDLTSTTSNASKDDIHEFVTTSDEVALVNTAGVANGTDAAALVNIAGIAGLTIDDIVADTAANLGASAVNVGDQSAKFTSGGYAYETDTGNLYYDADGDFTAGVELVAALFSTGIGGADTAVVAVAGDFQFGIA